MRATMVLLAVLVGWTVAWSAPRAQEWVSFVEHKLIALALDMVSSPGSFEVQVGSIEDTDDGLTNLLDVRISDGSGIWMTIERLAFAWRPSRLIEGELAIPDLRVTGATVLRAPADKAVWPELKPQKPWQRDLLDWPRAPIKLALDRIRFERIDIREGILPQAIQFNAEGRMHDREDVQEIMLALQRTDAVAGEIAFEARRDFPAGTLRLSLQGREAAGGMVSAASGFPADVPARLQLLGEGPPDDWRLSFLAAVEGVVTANGQAAVDYSDALTVDSRVTVRPGPAMNQDLRDILGDEARLTLAVTERSSSELDIVAAELRTAAAVLRVSGSFSTAGRSNDLDVSIVADSSAATLVEELAFERLTFNGRVTGPGGALEASGQVTVEAPETGAIGAARVEAQANVKQGSAGTTFVLAGKAAKLRVAHMASTGIGDATLRVTGALSDRRLVIEAADMHSRLTSGEAGDNYDIATGMESPLLTATARGDVDLASGRIDLMYSLRVPDVARIAAQFDQRAAGALEASGRVAGPRGNVELAGTVAGTDCLYEGTSYGRLRLTHDIRVGDTVTGRIGIAMVGGWLGHGSADAVVGFDRDRWRLEDVKLNVAGVEIASDAVVISTGTMLAEGKGVLTASDVRFLAAVAGLEASGTVEGAFALGAKDGRQTLASTLRVAQAEVSGFVMRQAVLDIAVGDLTAGEKFDLKLSVLSGGVGPLAVDALDVQATGAAAALDFSGSVVGALAVHRAELVLEGQAALVGEQLRVAVTSGSASIGALQTMLHSPVELHIDRTGDRFETNEFDLRLSGGGRLSGALSRHAAGLAGHLRGVGIPVAPLADLARLQTASGFLDVTATFDTRRTGSLAEIEIDARDLALTHLEAGDTVSVAASGRWDGARLDLQGVIEGSFREPVAAQLVLPVHVGKNGLPRLSEGGPVGGTLSWHGKIADLSAMMPPSPHVMDGDVDLHLSISGTVEAPRLSGRLGLAQGSYAHIDAGLGLVGVAIEATMTESAVVLLKYSATDGGYGQVHGDAMVHLGPRPTVDAVLRLGQALLLQRDDITARISGAGRLQGPWNRLAFDGEFTVDEAEIRLINAMPPDAVALDGIRVPQAPEKPEVEASHLAAVDITVRAARDVFVRGRGLESEWSLNLRAMGDVSSPVLSGTVSKVRGSLNLLGRPFELTRGEVLLDGTPGLDPVIDVSLERETRDIHGGIYVTGRLSKPLVRFESRSGLPSDEVLPRLLFGVSQQSLTSLQALQLSLGIAGLLGHGVGIQDRIRQTVGVDVLRFSGTTGEDAAVIAGQNLGERVFVGAEQQIGSGQSSVLVEVTLMDNVIVDSRTEAGQGSSIGMTWRHDY